MLKHEPFFQLVDDSAFSNSMQLGNRVTASKSMGSQKMWHNVLNIFTEACISTETLSELVASIISDFITFHYISDSVG